MKKQPKCKNCQGPHYTTFCRYQPPKLLSAPRKPIRKRGKRTIEYEIWRDEVAKPYLDAEFGHICSVDGCEETGNLDVDHILNRGSHYHLRMSLSNVQYLCRPHHQMKTDRL